jgi:hypothetical protein
MTRCTHIDELVSTQPASPLGFHPAVLELAVHRAAGSFLERVAAPFAAVAAETSRLHRAGRHGLTPLRLWERVEGARVTATPQMTQVYCKRMKPVAERKPESFVPVLEWLSGQSIEHLERVSPWELDSRVHGNLESEYASA